MNTRPASTEFDPFYRVYVDAVPKGDLLTLLASGVEETLALLRTCPVERERFRYAPGKWSIREVVGHLADAERMYAYRAFHFARQELSRLPGFDGRSSVVRSGASERALADLADEFSTVRAATVSLLGSLDERGWSALGVASGRPFSVRSLAYVIAGHEIHHRRLLSERYL